MANEDFDVNRLAAYLHMMPADVVKLAESLPAGQKAVIRAMFVDGRDTKETASVLSMSEGAVRVALHRGLAGLARMLRGSV